MAAADLGKRLKCGACGARFYDLHRAQPICPKCKTPYISAAPVAALIDPDYEDEEDFETELDDDDEDGDEVEELDLDSDHIPAPIGGTDADDDDTGDPALDELDEAELPDDSFGGFGDDD